jgi:hypothetical protein
MSGNQAASRWRFLISPRWLGWHLLVIVSVLGMLWLGDWQLRRAEAGNALSWAYTFEWPLFSIFAVVFWFKTIRDEFNPPAATDAEEVALPAGVAAPPGAGHPGDDGGAGGGDGDSDDEELAAYNAYLARLTKEVRGHGRWHGLR